MRVIRCDGSPAAVERLRAALERTLAGGRAVAPIVGPDDTSAGREAADGHAVVTTSGSGGEPKRVLLPAGALLASAQATHTRLGGPGHWLLALPAQHIAGLQVLTRSVVAGTDPEVLDLRGGFDPAAFADAAARLRRRQQSNGRCYTALVPTQLHRLLETDESGLAAFDAVLLGGAAAPAGLVQQARQRGIPVVTTYGMTETAGGCVYDGRSLDGVRVRTDRHAMIRLTGPTLAAGYLDGTGPPGPPWRDGWVDTPDLGRLDATGALHLLGRADDVIVTGGFNVAPAPVEAALTAQPGVAEACVVGLGHPEWGQQVVAAVVPADPAHAPQPQQLRDAVRGQLGSAHTPKAVLALDFLPLHGPGKPDRAAVAEQAARRLR